MDGAMTPQQEAVLQNKVAIFESVTNTAEQLISTLKQYPKENKYFFKKDYSRGLSRRNKVKRKKVLLNITMQRRMGAAQIALIQSQPIPKFPKGTI